MLPSGSRNGAVHYEKFPVPFHFATCFSSPLKREAKSEATFQHTDRLLHSSWPGEPNDDTAAGMESEASSIERGTTGTKFIREIHAPGRVYENYPRRIPGECRHSADAAHASRKQKKVDVNSTISLEIEIPGLRKVGQTLQSEKSEKPGSCPVAGRVVSFIALQHNQLPP